MFKDKILELRKKAGLSQEELANQLGVSRQSVSKWENGSSFPEMEKCIEICKLFHVSMDELFFDEPNKTIDETMYDNIVSVIHKNNHRQWLAMGISFLVVGCIALTGIAFTIDANKKLQQTQSISDSFMHQYQNFMDKLTQIENNMSNQNDTVSIQFTSIQYLNNQEAQIQMETMLSKEYKNDRVEVIFEFDNEKKTVKLEKKELNYVADTILPIQNITNATLVVTNGDEVTNYNCFVNDSDYEFKSPLVSQWAVKNVKKKKDQLIFYMDRYNVGQTFEIEEITLPYAEIERIEFQDSQGKIVKSFAMPEKIWDSPINFDVRKIEDSWTIYFIYEKDGLRCRQNMGSFVNNVDEYAYNAEFFYFNSTDNSLPDIEILE